MQRELLGAMLGAGLLVASAGGCGSSEGTSDFTGDDDDGGGTSGATASGGKGSSGGSIGGGSSGDGGGGATSSSGGAACATAQSKAERQPVYLDIVLDGSGSMDAQLVLCKSERAARCAANTYEAIDYSDQCGGNGEYGVCLDKLYTELDPEKPARYTGKKWIAARGALEAYFAASSAVPSNNLGVGLFLFSSTQPSSSPVRVLDATQAAALAGQIRPETFPANRTPMRASIASQTAYMRSFVNEAPLAANGRRVLLLITDGVPLGNDGDPSETTANVMAAVQAGLDGNPKVETAVIGVGNPSADPTTFDETFLSQLAKLGGLAPVGCNENWSDGSASTPCHLQVTPGAKTAEQIKDEMIAAINAVAGSVASCNLTLDKSSPIDPASVNVVYVDAAGVESQIPQDASNGWSYDNPTDPSQVILHGTACATLQSDNGAVNIVIGCPTGTTVVH